MPIKVRGSAVSSSLMWVAICQIVRYAPRSMETIDLFHTRRLCYNSAPFRNRSSKAELPISNGYLTLNGVKELS